MWYIENLEWKIPSPLLALQQLLQEVHEESFALATRLFPDILRGFS